MSLRLTPGGRQRRRASAALTVLAAGAIAVPAIATTATAADEPLDCSTVPWMDTSLTAGERADALLDASSQHQIYRWLVEQPANSPTRVQWNPGFTGEAPVIYPAQVECTPNVVYTNGAEGIHRTAGTTAWPVPVANAATWDLDLQVERGAAIADESFDKGRNVVLGPGVNSARAPLSGRTSEYFGEDPVLSGLLAGATMRGIEDENDPDKPVVANLKHYYANEQELDRSASSSNMSERVAREIYSLPYEIAVTDSDPGSIMCSYNQVNGVWACEDPIMQNVLKDEVGFSGYIMSDFGSVHSTGPSLMAGMDQELNRPRWFTPARLDAALAAGEITQERIEEAAKRVISTYIGEGLFDHPLPTDTSANASTPEHKALALEIAQKSMVLLKNEEALPLAPASGDSIAIIGATASKTPTNGISAIRACSTGTTGNVLNCDAIIDPLTAITERAAQDGASVTFNGGTELASVAADAAAADVAIVFGYTNQGEFSDMPDMVLDNGGDALIEAVAGANPNTVVVLQTGSAVEMPWLDDVPAVMEAWHAGEQVGPALASLLFGDVAPSGKLPMAFTPDLETGPLLTAEQYPGVEIINGIRQVEYSEGLEVGYRWFEANGVDPLFDFGHGLTYTDFAYSKLQITPTSHSGTNDVRVRFRLTNTGDTAATEVAQVYLELPASAGEPSKRLAGWQRVTLEPGEHKNVQVTFTGDDLEDLRLLQYFEEASGEWTTPTGTFTVHVGGSVDTVLEDTFTQK
ncbi:beta-glucosidase [Demequina silvatica]|uniref:beta-glucosidase n=1 Tax=Demequina silvatica TaxID=1638988 RepID=UPI00078203AB|nr:glycoside hydrolase family 3 C-terminal domain-containing protein [Demequina silvatica]